MFEGEEGFKLVLYIKVCLRERERSKGEGWPLIRQKSGGGVQHPRFELL